MRFRFAISLLLLLLMGCSSGGWSPQERAIINGANYSRMSVLSVESPTDSLTLRTPSAPLSKEELLAPEFGRLVASMIESVNNPQNEGVGIAAPQVGILRRVVVVQRLDKAAEPFEVYVNPQIISYGEELSSGSEGCLSVPNRRGEVRRSQAITITYNHPITFEPCEEHIEGFVAVIFQHEIDHLDGILYTDRADSVVVEQ